MKKYSHIVSKDGEILFQTKPSMVKPMVVHTAFILEEKFPEAEGYIVHIRTEEINTTIHDLTETDSL